MSKISELTALETLADDDAVPCLDDSAGTAATKNKRFLLSTLRDWLAAMTNPMTTAGDLIKGGASGTPARLAAGTEGHRLTIVSGVPAWAADLTASQILDAVKTVDGAGSGLDADLLDGQSSAAFATAAQGSAGDAAKAKTDHLTVTQPVDLDAIEARVNALDAAVVLVGAWDASAGTFPGGGSAQAGWSYLVSVAGTVDGTAFAQHDRLIAIADDASTTTFSGNWFKADYTDQVLSVAGLTGAIGDSALRSALDLDNRYVNATDAETVAGVKTFSSSPVVPTPTTDYQAATKKYVDDTAVALTGAQTVAGVKTFSSSPVVPTPSTDYQAATKKYVDDNAAAASGVSNPSVAYVRSDGNDATGAPGDPALAYLTAQAAWDDGARSFDLGVGSWTITHSGSGGVVDVFVRGQGPGIDSASTTLLLYWSGTDGSDGADGDSQEYPGGGTAGGAGANAPGLHLVSDGSVRIRFFGSGGDGGDGGDGGNATGSADANGGNGGNGGNSGDGPQVTFRRCLITEFSCGPGVEGAGGSGGSGYGSGMSGTGGIGGTASINEGGVTAIFCELMGATWGAISATQPGVWDGSTFHTS